MLCKGASILEIVKSCATPQFMSFSNPKLIKLMKRGESEQETKSNAATFKYMALISLVTPILCLSCIKYCMLAIALFKEIKHH